MPTTVHAYGAPAVGAPLVPVAIERRDVGPHDVKLDILFCGICHSDIHFVSGDFGPLAVEPFVPGHEIVGVVTEVGPEVTKHKVGDRVGIGCMVESCRTCENCLAGEQQYCVNGSVLVFGGLDPFDGTITQGGYSQEYVANEDYIVHVPESLDPAAAAPLLCAGITVYSPLRRWNTGPGTRVAVLGLGGLGHLGVKMAKAMGAEVTVLSRTEAKRADALALGADDYYATEDPAVFAQLSNRFDIVLNTVSAPIDVDAYLGTLRREGTLANVGLTTQSLSYNPFSIMTAGRSISASSFGSIRETQEMLDFAAEHGVTADIEVIDAAQVNDAFERVLASDVRYRFVIDSATYPGVA
ncbi:NAD(P)-dependent alcohol dehydrogenase [Microbacterium sp. X-17]|uniref:NAD(P)-dependent alcohol dehydrogenase n=1 Tax=Microbacterium sp. X-17 TaxID=3144404 RepID=UPI0031F504F9